MSGLLIGLSVLVALVCVVITWRTRQEAERRSHARVLALSALIDPPGRVERVAAPAAMPAPVNPFARMAIGFGGVAAAVGVVLVVAHLAGRAPQPAEATIAAPRLELLTMTSTRQGRMLTVDGAVRNGGPVQLGGVAAEVLLLDAQGRRVADGRAALSATSLAPGTVARFHVEIPGDRAAGRYRVSFRNGAGVVRHIDLRAAARREAAASAGDTARTVPADRRAGTL